MTLKTFFRLPYKTDDFKPDLSSAYSSFEKRYIYQDEYLVAKVRIINYKEKHTHVFLYYKINNETTQTIRYLCKHEFVRDKILLTNFSQ